MKSSSAAIFHQILATLVVGVTRFPGFVLLLFLGAFDTSSRAVDKEQY
jgi:hypothetical protein